MRDGKIFYSIVDNACVLKLVGAIMYNIGPGFDRFIEDVIHKSDIDAFTIDLTETSYIDSTNLGLLAKLPKYSSHHVSTPPVMISNQDSINEVLDNVGFTKIFTIVNCYDEDLPTLQEIPRTETNERSLSQTVLKAHRELVDLNKPNKDRFTDVVEYLERDTGNEPA